MTLLERFCTLYYELHTIDVSRLQDIYTHDVVFIDPIEKHYGLSSVQVYISKLLSQAESCRFEIHNTITEHLDTPSAQSHAVIWTMHLKIKQKADPILLDGITQLKVRNDRIYFHRDYYDMGQMVYEQIPVLSWFIRKVKQRLRT